MIDEQERPLSKKEQVAAARELEKNRESARLRQQRKRERDRAAKLAGELEKQATEAANFSASEEISEKAAKQIISTEWGISRSHVIDSVYTWGKQAAEQLRIPKSIFYWINGPVHTIASIKANEAQPLAKLEGDNIVVGEVTYRREIFAIYHFMEAWRPEAVPTFEEYLAERRSVKVDGTINRGNKYFGKDFHEQPHARWDDFVVPWNPDGLKPDYSQDDAKKWLASQSEDKKRLLIACRNSYKSNFSLVYLVGAVLCLPDIRLLFVTETKPLSKSFLAGFRQFFEVSNPRDPRRFVRLFPEYCVPVGDGNSLEFQSPMRILGLFQPTANSTSMESGGWAGSRSDYTLFSDAISSNTVGTEDQIQKSVTNTDAILELSEIGSYVHWEGTPWHENDLYAQLIERNDRSPEKNLLVIVDPAWTVLESGKGKDIFALEEADVSLLFPARLTWKVLQQKLRSGDPKARTFRMQSLCEFLPLTDEDEKLQFNRAEFERNTVEVVPPNNDFIYASGDLAFSKSRYADATCFSVFSVVENKLYVLTQAAGQWRDSEKAEAIVRLQKQYPYIQAWAIEKYPSFERLDEDVKREAMKQGVRVTIKWVKADNRADAKFHKLKTCQTYLNQDRIKFLKGNYLEDLINELERLDGSGPKRRSSFGKHDDRGDSLAIGIQYFLPDPDDETAAIRKKLEEEEQSRRELDQQYDYIYGPSYEFGANVSRASDWRQANRSTDPLPETNTDLPGFHRCWPVRDSSTKALGFGYQKKIPPR